MSILIQIEEYIRKRKIQNRQKIFNKVQEVLRQIDLDTNGRDGLITSAASACNYDTLYFTTLRILEASNSGLKKDKNFQAKSMYKNCRALFGFIKFVLDFYGGVLGVFWL